MPFIGRTDYDSVAISSIMREAMYVPETNSCKELLRAFQESKVQMAIVVDEYGGTSGVVTMEDLLESIVGNIQDEYDNEEEEIQKVCGASERSGGGCSLLGAQGYRPQNRQGAGGAHFPAAGAACRREGACPGKGSEGTAVKMGIPAEKPGIL